MKDYSKKYFNFGNDIRVKSKRVSRNNQRMELLQFLDR